MKYNVGDRILFHSSRGDYSGVVCEITMNTDTTINQVGLEWDDHSNGGHRINYSPDDLTLFFQFGMMTFVRNYMLSEELFEI